MADADFAELGFAEGLVRGARTFRLSSEGGLMGLYYRQLWRPGLNYSLCRKKGPVGFSTTGMMPSVRLFPPTPDEGFKAPDRGHLIDCRCGFYGYFDGSNDYNSKGSGAFLVEGVIEGWGETVIGSRGFRCTKARIVALVIDQDWQRPLLETYGVPAFSTFATMVAAYPGLNGSPEIEEVES
jgi:hypothetical protein